MKYTIKHPRKIIWVMRDFIDSANDLMCMRKEGSKKIYIKRYVQMVPMNAFCAYISDRGPIFRIGYDETDIACRELGHTDFSVNFYKSYPSARGFATITLVLLHELGHFYTSSNRSFFDWLEKQDKLEEIEETYHTRRERNFAYFKLPDEEKATNWAIEWLKCPENRKKAKQFEKKFFACLTKN